MLELNKLVLIAAIITRLYPVAYITKYKQPISYIIGRMALIIGSPPTQLGFNPYIVYKGTFYWFSGKITRAQEIQILPEYKDELITAINTYEAIMSNKRKISTHIEKILNNCDSVFDVKYLLGDEIFKLLKLKQPPHNIASTIAHQFKIENAKLLEEYTNIIKLRLIDLMLIN